MLRFCNSCNVKCDNCRIKQFVNFIYLQLTPSKEIRNIMKTDKPTDVKYRQGKYKQSSGRMLK